MAEKKHTLLVMKETKHTPHVVTAQEKDLKTAIDNIYKKYGTDLRAFFRDVRAELLLKRQESLSKQNRAE